MALRALLLIDARSAPRLSDAVASIAASSAWHVTVVAVPRWSPLWRYAPLSGLTSPEELHQFAEDDARDVLRRIVNELPLGYSVEHRVLSGWGDVVALLRGGLFQVAVLAASPGRRDRRTIAAAIRASGTSLVIA